MTVPQRYRIKTTKLIDLITKPFLLIHNNFYIEPAYVIHFYCLHLPPYFWQYLLLQSIG